MQFLWRSLALVLGMLGVPAHTSLQARPEFNCEEWLYSKSPSILKQVDPSLKEKLIQAAQHLLLSHHRLDDQGAFKSKHVLGWEVLHELGADPAEVHALTAKALDQMLAVGRDSGLRDLSQRQLHEVFALPILAPSFAIKRDAPFIEKYELDDYRQAFAGLTHLPLSAGVLAPYASGLGDAYKVATMEGLTSEAAECFLFALRLRNYDVAIASAEFSHDEAALFAISYVALYGFFLDSPAYWLKNLDGAIEALGRIRGRYQPLAAQMLVDLAGVLMDEDFSETVKTLVGDSTQPWFTTTQFESWQGSVWALALRALAYSGEVVQRQTDYRGRPRANFFTQVNDPATADKIRLIFDRIEKNFFIDVFPPDLLRAQISLGLEKMPTENAEKERPELLPLRRLEAQLRSTLSANRRQYPDAASTEPLIRKGTAWLKRGNVWQALKQFSLAYDVPGLLAVAAHWEKNEAFESALQVYILIALIEERSDF